MTCRFELESKGPSYTRSCNECGLGPCKHRSPATQVPERMGYTNDKPDLSQIPAKDLASKITIEKYAADPKPRLTRVQRAKLMDWLADNIMRNKPFSDNALNAFVDEILDIIDNP